MPRIPHVVGRREPLRDPDGISGRRFQKLVNSRLPGKKWTSKSLPIRGKGKS